MENNYTTVSDGDEFTSSCPCCGRPVYAGAGELHSVTIVVADYWYRWAEGHEGRFTLAIARRNADGAPVEGAGVIVVSGRVDADNIVYSVLEPEESPWSEFGAFGRVISREEALEHSESIGLFDLVDAVAAREDRLSSRILSCRLRS